MSDEVPDKKEDLAEGTLMSHLVELRSRLFKVFGSVFAIFVILLPFAQKIFNFAAEPLIGVVPGGQLIALSPVSPLTATIMLSFYIALFLAMLQVLAVPPIGFFVVIILVFFILTKLWQ